MNVMLKRARLLNDFVRRPPLVYRRLRRMVERLEAASLSERQAFTETRLQRVIEAAGRSGRYKREALPDSYGDFPYFSNAVLRDSAGDTFASSLVPWTAASTSGTTGVPVALRRSLPSVVMEQVALDAVAARMGVELAGARVAVIRGDAIKDPSDSSPPFWQYTRGGRTLLLSSNHLSRDTVDAYWDELVRFHPRVIWAYPTTLEALIGLAGDTRDGTPDLELVLTSSEVLRSETRSAMSRAVGVPICDYYGQAERVSLAWSARPDEYLFSVAYGKTELSFSHSDPDHDYYEIIGTSFWNLVQPLIRYRTGDLAILPRGLSSEAIEEVCYGMRPFLGVGGRDADYLVAPNGAKLVGIDHIPRGVEHVVQMQLTQTAPNAVEIAVVPKAGYSDETTKQILKNARIKIPASMKVQVKVVERLHRTTRGKASFVRRLEGAPTDSIRPLRSVPSRSAFTDLKSVTVLVPGQQGGVDRLFEGLDLSAAQDTLGFRVTLFTTHGSLYKGVLLFPWRLSRFAGLLVRKKIDLCHINISSKGSTLRKVIFGWLCRRFDVPYLLHLHGSQYREFFAGLDEKPKRKVRDLYQGAAGVLVLGKVWRAFVMSEIGVEDRKAIVLPNAVSGPSSPPEDGKDDPPRILFLGRLGERKGVPELIDALSDPSLQTLEWTATLAGDGDVDGYRALVARRGLSERVSLPGWVGPDDVSDLLGRSTMLVLPSHAENLPLSMLEGMAYGLPTVVTPVGAVTDVIEDGSNGVLVSVGSASELTRAIRDLLENPTRGVRLGEAARAAFEKDYDARNYPAALLGVYADVLSGPDRGEVKK